MKTPALLILRGNSVNEKQAWKRLNFSSTPLGSWPGLTIKLMEFTLTPEKHTNFFIIFLRTWKPSQEKQRPKEAIRAKGLHIRLDER